MTKKCQKLNCENEAIKRGKYCVEHCTSKKFKSRDERTDDEIIEEIRRNLIREREMEEYLRKKEEEKKINELRYAEERLLIEQQEKEYQDALKKDIEKMNHENELKRKQIEKEKEFEMLMNEKIRMNNERENDEYYKIKFVFQNLGGLSIISTFSKDDFFEYVFNFVDVFLHDSNIPFPTNGYELISYPNITLCEQEHSQIKISEKFAHKNVQLTFKEIEK